MIFVDFVYLLRDHGLPIGMQEVLDFYRGLGKGLVEDMDALFLYARLAFVKRPEHLDRFERAFMLYFYDIDLPRVVEGDPELLQTKQFRKWLEEAVQSGELPKHALWTKTRDELMQMFWDRIREQMEAHHGGNKWVGTGGTSPFGHSGFANRGFRVHGQSQNRSAMKVIGDRRYISYDSGATLRGENIRQVLTSLKHMVPVGAADELDLDQTIAQTAKQGGEIELVFKRQKLDRIRLVVLIDNGGSSMWPFVKLTRLLFSKIQNRFKESQTFYFHNTIYSVVYRDANRRKPLPIKELLRYPEDTRLFIIGDASMAPEELFDAYGAIEFDREDRMPSIERLRMIRDRFPYAVWLNPIHKEEWPHAYGAWTIKHINEVFYMEDMTLRGVKTAVEHLVRKAESPR